MAPLDCCGLCLDDDPSAVGCEDLNFCSQNGVCSFGTCECFEGWGGADCALTASGGDDLGVPWWGVALIVSGTLVLVSGSGIALRSQLLRPTGESPGCGLGVPW